MFKENISYVETDRATINFVSLETKRQFCEIICVFRTSEPRLS